MRPRRDCLGDMSLRILVGSLAAVVLGALLACGQSGDDESVQVTGAPMPTTFDLLESGFHQSTVGVALGERVEVSVEVRQERHDQHICGVPSVVDPFGNVLQTLTPRQNAASWDGNPLCLRVLRYAFFAAVDGEYGVKLENRGCLLDDVARHRDRAVGGLPGAGMNGSEGSLQLLL